MVGAKRLERLILKATAALSRFDWVPFTFGGLMDTLRRLDKEAADCSIVECRDAIREMRETQVTY